MNKVTVTVMDGDRIVHAGTSTAVAPAPTPTLDFDGELFSGEGPPTSEVVALMEPGDIYLDTISGNVLRLDP